MRVSRQTRQIMWSAAAQRGDNDAAAKKEVEPKELTGMTESDGGTAVEENAELQPISDSLLSRVQKQPSADWEKPAKTIQT
jgi:hypothetical protein